MPDNEQNAKLSDGSGVPFAQIKDQVREILSCQARKEDRIKKRRTEAKKGSRGTKFKIPLYKPETWMKESAVLNSSDNSSAALKSHLYRFYQAASIHRQFVLRELLPDEPEPLPLPAAIEKHRTGGSGVSGPG